ncbi:TolC family protein [Rhizosphaericola mali]|uniref:TolC family protein n=1 Tax=Rhizosphaericola mali TaxID=2545455 RepID=A0A5P2G393_9BACT|nr:TolC family protein [Rhizosphaericola mali]QES87573.1 TolC family protein [Rhizosphaericola mali]
MKKIAAFIIGALAFSSGKVHAQAGADTILHDVELETCIQYALNNYPLIKQNLLDQKITESQIKGKLSAWYPQVNTTSMYQNTFQKLTTVTTLGVFSAGTYNTSQVAVAASQNLFNRDALLASKSAEDVRQNTRNTTISNKIDLVANVSKTYYSILTLMQQIKVLDEDIIRLQRSHKDAFNQYKAGTVDNTGYKQAQINLNTSIAQKRGYESMIPSYYEQLRTFLNYPNSKELTIHYDSLALEQSAIIDTNSTVNWEKRIEYKTLQTNKNLLMANLKYEKWSYLPTVSLYATYNLNYFNNRFSPLYNNNFPQSYVGLQVTMPIFQGGLRKQNIRQAQLNLDRNDFDFQNLKNTVNQQYQTAISTYKSDFANYQANKENMELAQEVYNTVDLQYRAGVKMYLDVITAETTLRTAKINYTNSLFLLLSDKVDVQKALGDIQPN